MRSTADIVCQRFKRVMISYKSELIKGADGVSNEPEIKINIVL